jgi:hypothetical protein
MDAPTKNEWRQESAMKKYTVALIAMTLVPACVYAVDGQVLINQSTVMAAGGFPYVISQPGSYKLSGNLNVTATNTDAININSDDVALDLNGFRISGPANCLQAFCGAGFGIGISTGSHSNFLLWNNITVKNGSIRGFAFGIELSGAGLVSDLNTTNNGVGIVIEGPFVISRCTAIRNDYGIFANFAILLSSTASSNFLYGVSATGSSISDTIANDNGASGFIVNSSTLVHVTAIRNTGGYGIVAGGGDSKARSVVGSSTVQFNTPGDLDPGGKIISQNNNVCSNGGC